MNARWGPSPGAASIEFSIDVEPKCDTVKLIPAGELDIATVGQLQSELYDLIDAGFGRIVIDLRGVDFIDSTGLHLLVSAHERAKNQDSQLAIVPGRRAVQQVLEITGTIEDLPFTPSTNASSSSDPIRYSPTDLAHKPTGTVTLTPPVQQPRYPWHALASRRGQPTPPQHAGGPNTRRTVVGADGVYQLGAPSARTEQRDPLRDDAWSPDRHAGRRGLDDSARKLDGWKPTIKH